MDSSVCPQRIRYSIIHGGDTRVAQGVRVVGVVVVMPKEGTGSTRDGFDESTSQGCFPKRKDRGRMGSAVLPQREKSGLVSGRVHEVVNGLRVTGEPGTATSG